MAVEGEEVVEYESDPEDALLPSAMRRREASDDEGGEGLDGVPRLSRRDPSAGDDSDGQGGAPVYEDEEDGVFDEEEVGVETEEVGGLCGVVDTAAAPKESIGEVDGLEDNEQVEEEGAGKKENEPYTVPTVGAFYMHDDRCRDSGPGRHRRMLGERKLWESKDECAWVHDRFDEMNLQDAHHNEETRMKKGQFRGRGRGRGRARGSDHGYGRRNSSQTYNDGYQQNQAPKIVRGRGPVRYEPASEGLVGTYATQYDQHRSGKAQESISKLSTRRQVSRNSTVVPNSIIDRRDAMASSLSSCSPPFYPSESSKQDASVIQKRGPHSGTDKRLSSMQLHEEDYTISHSGSVLRGKPTTDTKSTEGRRIHNHVRPISGKTLANSRSLESSVQVINAIQSSHSTVQDRDVKIVTPVSVRVPSHTHVRPISGKTLANSWSLESSVQVINAIQSSHSTVQDRDVKIVSPVSVRVPSHTHRPTVQQRPAPPQTAPRVSAQQLCQQPGIVPLGVSASRGPSTNLSDAGQTESSEGSSKSRSQSATKGKSSNQGSEIGSFLYNGAQVSVAAGAMGLAHSDRGFPATPALLPVMQFGGQHHGVGMALPGYVARPQLGFGNSEMSWVPMLAGGAGALGASYGSPYVTLDSNYFTQFSERSSSSVSSKESSTSKSCNTVKPPVRPEITDDEYGQRQNKPRRYSEMSFGH